jgi:hypothetical protein
MEIFGIALIVIASLIYDYKTKKEGLRRGSKKGASNAELAAIKDDLAAMRSELRQIEERIADLTLMLDRSDDSKPRLYLSGSSDAESRGLPNR